LKRAGIDAPLATPEALTAGRKGLGDQFTDLSARNTLMPDAQFSSDLGKALENYNALTSETARAPGVSGYVNDFLAPRKGDNVANIADTFDAAPSHAPISPPAPSYNTGPAKPPVEKAQTLVDFVQKTGGVNDAGGDLKSMGMDRFPGLIRKDGRPLDSAREAAAEAGFMGYDPEHAVSNTTVADFLDALGEHPKFSAHDADRMGAYSHAKSAFEDYQATHKNFSDQIRQDLLETGHRPSEIDPQLLDRAAHIAAQGETPWQNAYESAAIRAVDENAPRAVLPSEKAGLQPPAPIAGEKYQNMRSMFSADAKRLQNSDPAQAQAYRDLRNALDNGMTRSIAPEDAAAWGDARQKWGNLKDLEKAAGAAGENAAQGYISPAQLKAAVSAGNKRGAYARGQGDLAELARAGVGTMTPLPNSGSPGRANAQHFAQLLGGVGGAFAGGGEGALAGLAAATAGPAVLGRALMSKPVQAYLSNQLAPRIGLISQLDPKAAALAQALIAEKGVAALPQSVR
jgi:hypothetical protein